MFVCWNHLQEKKMMQRKKRAGYNCEVRSDSHAGAFLVLTLSSRADHPGLLCSTRVVSGGNLTLPLSFSIVSHALYSLMSGVLRGSIKKISYPGTHFDNDSVDFHHPPNSLDALSWMLKQWMNLVFQSWEHTQHELFMDKPCQLCDSFLHHHFKPTPLFQVHFYPWL